MYIDVIYYDVLCNDNQSWSSSRCIERWMQQRADTKKNGNMFHHSNSSSNSWSCYILFLVAGLEHQFVFFHILGMSWSQLTFIFFRGVAQPPTSYFRVEPFFWDIQWRVFRVFIRSQSWITCAPADPQRHGCTGKMFLCFGRVWCLFAVSLTHSPMTRWI